MNTSYIQRVVNDAQTKVEDILRNSEAGPPVVIRQYTAAIAVNFTDWIGKTILWVRHEDARHALVSNLRCETVDDHVGMLLRFAALSRARPDLCDYMHTDHEVDSIREMLADPLTAGLSGVVLCAVLESTSEIFIPDLAHRARECGCTDFEYTNVHGKADIEHSAAFLKATEAEQTMGYREPQFLISNAAEEAIRLIERIYGKD